MEYVCTVNTQKTMKCVDTQSEKYALLNATREKCIKIEQMANENGEAVYKVPIFQIHDQKLFKISGCFSSAENKNATQRHDRKSVNDAHKQ